MIREFEETRQELGYVVEHARFLEHAREHDKQLCDPDIPILGEDLLNTYQELKGTRRIIFSLMLDLGLLQTKY